MGQKSKILSVLVWGLLLTACARPLGDVESKVGDDVENGAACTDFSSKLSATLGQALIDGEELPTEESLRASLQKRLGDEKQELVEKAVNVYRILTIETQYKLGLQDRNELLSAMMGLEIGDETTPEKAALKARIHQAYGEVQVAAKTAGSQCVPSADPGSNPVTPPPPVSQDPTLALPVAGAVKVMMTAYQSCQAKRLPAMTAATDSVASNAIVVTGTHPNGVGLKREIGNLESLKKTHYYIREGTEKGTACFDVPNHPLIYDYGGKPYTSTATDSTLNFFKNAGSGTSVLGIDCSGYVFSALAASGLRVSPSKRLTASLVHGINARMYMEPVANGLSCLAPVALKGKDVLRNGDILASGGHIVMVDRVGADPFGVFRFKSSSDCRAENISSKNFDFEVLQSAPVKNGIGIDRMKAADYFASSSDMKTALVQYAIAACQSNLGQASTPKPASARLVRHKLTEECKDRPVRLEGESCINACL